MKNLNVKLLALAALLTFGASSSKGFAQEDEDIVYEDDAITEPAPAVEEVEEGEVAPAEDESYDFSEEDY